MAPWGRTGPGSSLPSGTVSALVEEAARAAGSPQPEAKDCKRSCRTADQQMTGSSQLGASKGLPEETRS